MPSPRGLELLPSLQEDRGGGGGSHRALVGPLPSMHQVVLLQVGELGEALLAQGALERALPTVHSQMDLSQAWEKCCQPPRAPRQGQGSSSNLSPHPRRTPFWHQGLSIPLPPYHLPEGRSTIPQAPLGLSAALRKGRWR